MLTEPDLVRYGADLRKKTPSELQRELSRLVDQMLFQPAATAQRLAALSQVAISRMAQ